MDESKKKQVLEEISKDLDATGKDLVAWVQKMVDAQSTPRMTREFRAIEIDRLIAILQLIKINSTAKLLVETDTLLYEIEQGKLNVIAREIYSRTYGPLVSLPEQIDYVLTYLSSSLQREIAHWRKKPKKDAPKQLTSK